MIVEDGTIVAGANSLVSIEFADAYAVERSLTQWTGALDKPAALVLGTSWVLNKHSGMWKGSIVDPLQPLSWPRTGVTDGEGRLIADTEIPTILKQAIVEAAIRFARGEELYADPPVEGRVTSYRSQVGPISEATTYAEGTILDRPTVSIVDDLIRGLLKTGYGNVRPLARWF